MSEIYVKQKSSRILREALARVCRVGHPVVTQEAIKALKEFSASVFDHCQCPELAPHPSGVYMCLDCGRAYRDPNRKLKLVGGE